MSYILHNSNKKVSIIRKLLAQNSISLEEAARLTGIDLDHAEHMFSVTAGKTDFIETSLNGAYLIKPHFFRDERGFFVESYSRRFFENAGIDADFVQANHSMSVQKGVLRGLHFQLPPHEQAKLVRATKGSVYDVIVDLRKSSPTFGQWEGFLLSAENGLMLFIPRGFAHGFCTLESKTEFMYQTDNYYAPESDSGLIWNDPDLRIKWPTRSPILSDKDKNLQQFKYFQSPF